MPTDVSEENITSTFGLFFDPEDGGSVFLQDVS
jgi:hypothetical protein